MITNCSACSGIHNKLLHGLGMAFCHKLLVKVANVETKELMEAGSMSDDLSKVPDLNQPLLLEVQSMSVHGFSCKVM